MPAFYSPGTGVNAAAIENRMEQIERGNLQGQISRGEVQAGDRPEYYDFIVAQRLADRGVKHRGRRKLSSILDQRGLPFSGLTQEDLDTEGRRRRGRAGRSLLAAGGMGTDVLGLTQA